MYYKRLVLLLVALSLCSFTWAQGFNFGVGLGFLRQDAEGNLVVSVPFNFPITTFSKVGLELRTTADFIVSNQPDVSLLVSPLFSYNLDLLGVAPVTFYGGPSFRLFIEDAFAASRQSTWSFTGAVAGASLAVGAVAVPYGEVTWSVTQTGTLLSFNSGIGFKFRSW
jgi:hypothetical protein